MALSSLERHVFTSIPLDVTRIHPLMEEKHEALGMTRSARSHIH